MSLLPESSRHVSSSASPENVTSVPDPAFLGPSREDTSLLLPGIEIPPKANTPNSNPSPNPERRAVDLDPKMPE